MAAARTGGEGLGFSGNESKPVPIERVLHDRRADYRQLSNAELIEEIEGQRIGVVTGTARVVRSLARDFGLPAVVGTHTGARTIRDGMTITVGGNRNMVLLG